MKTRPGPEDERVHFQGVQLIEGTFHPIERKAKDDNDARVLADIRHFSDDPVFLFVDQDDGSKRFQSDGKPMVI